MRLPSATEYMEALQDPASCFPDPELAAGAPALTAIGLPRALSGNVATVFRVDCPTGRSYAVRCFIRSFDDEEQRYGAIRDHLDRHHPSWRVGFELQPQGIVVGDAPWPILKMEWSPGISLASYLERHLWDSPAIAYLAQRVAELALELGEAGVAHGDLQHGNILVLPGGALRLIDYDGMFVPGLEGLASNERGHRNYQHPCRARRDFGPHLDHFPSWVIYTSLVAVATDPLLWGRLDGGDECLLFRQEDLEAPQASPALAALEATGDEALDALARLLRRFLAGDIAAVPPLTPARAPQPALARGSATPVTPAELVEKQALYTALRGTAPAAAGGAGPEAGAPEDAGGARGKVPAPEPHRFEGKPSLPRTALLVAVGVVVVVVLATAVGALPPALGVLALLAVAGVVIAVGNHAYRALPEVGAARGAEEELDRCRAAAAAAEAVVDELAARRAAVDADEAAARERVAREVEELKRAEAAEVRAVEEELWAALASLTAQEQSSHKSESDALAAALADLREARMAEELSRRPLATASARGVSDQVLYGLALDGIRTAADFVDIEVRDGTAVVMAADGREIRVGAIGPREAQSILAWRRSIEDSVALLQPNKLPPETERELRARFTALREGLVAQEAPARAAAGAAAAEVGGRFAPRHEELAAGLRALEADAVQKRIGLDTQLAKARKDAAEAQWRVRSFEREAAAYRELTLLRFLRRLTRG